MSPIREAIIDNTISWQRCKPRSIPRVHWDHGDWIHHRGVGWGCHGWVRIVRWLDWVGIIALMTWMSCPFFSSILYLGSWIPGKTNNIKNPETVAYKMTWCSGLWLLSRGNFNLILHSCSVNFWWQPSTFFRIKNDIRLTACLSVLFIRLCSAV